MGIAATVIRPSPDDTPIETRIIWLPSTPEDVPPGQFSRREQAKVIGLRRDDVPTLPVGTLIDASERSGDAVQRWRVTDIDQQDVDHHRAYVKVDEGDY